MAEHPAIDDAELAEIHDFAVQLAKDAGQMLLDAVELRAGKTVREGHVEKESAVDLVTQTDEGEFRGAFFDKSFLMQSPPRTFSKP